MVSFPRDIADFPMYSGGTYHGKINALMNRCAHRGATVCRQREGSARYFTCGYHGWTYSNSGECVSVPGDDAYGPRLQARAL